ncbi:hypothetical protein CXB77_06045 (plasmid) [Chromatium okenii]|uniref:Uncharacterized protein n=2 Tax=Chromatium okenii TaxID=61644 RepID=A0A2S7XTK5_9GAMM|nr:hypothetical protein CXB77_06045 [Chromatium okenii]
MVMRDRPAPLWELAIGLSGMKSLETDLDEILNQLDANSRSIEKLGGDGIGFKAVPATEFDVNVCKFKSLKNQQLNNYGQHLPYLLQARGWSVVIDYTIDPDAEAAGAEIIAAIRGDSDENFDDAIINAADIDIARYGTLKTRYAPDKIESAQIERFEIRAALGQLPPVKSPALELDAPAQLRPLTKADLDLYNRGELRGLNKNFDAISAPAAVTERDRREVESGLNIAGRAGDGARISAIHTLFAALGSTAKPLKAK